MRDLREESALPRSTLLLVAVIASADAFDEESAEKAVTDDSRLSRLGATGILSAADLPELDAGVSRVFDLMKDGQWHSRDAICMAAGENGIPATAGDRRMRSLREWFIVDRRRIEGTRQFEYRLRPLPKADTGRQIELFGMAEDL